MVSGPTVAIRPRRECSPKASRFPGARRRAHAGEPAGVLCTPMYGCAARPRGPGHDMPAALTLAGGVPTFQRHFREDFMPIKVTDTSFQLDVLESKTPVLVDFWA